MAAPNRIILGSRGSELALAQARLVAEALLKAWPGLEVALETIRTSGDERVEATPIVDRKAGRKGMFTREIENELLVRRIDIAVHSAKDLPSDARSELTLAGTLPRARTDDVLITGKESSLTSLPAGATIATGSIRRQRQLRWRRPDLQSPICAGMFPPGCASCARTKAGAGSFWRAPVSSDSECKL